MNIKNKNGERIVIGISETHNAELENKNHPVAKCNYCNVGKSGHKFCSGRCEYENKIMKELELKHLSGYLPYGLRILIHGTEEVLLTGLETETPSTQERIIYKDSKRNFYKTYFYEISPILRPLSYLTKEIEVNGEKFVPYDELEKMSLFNDIRWILCNDLTECKHITIQKLFEWHFDIHGLIENNLAIDINAL